MGDIVLIEIKAWWLLIVPFLLTFSLFVIALIMKKSNESVNLTSKEKTLTSWITKKDILYWLLIFCLGIISLLTYQYRASSEVISHWGFAGTIVSIILAVVAIGFTLFQTLSSDLSSEKIAISAERIEKASVELDTNKIVEAGNIITTVADEISNHYINLENKLENLNSHIFNMKNEQKTHFENITSALFQNNEYNAKTNFEEVDYLVKSEVFVEKVFPHLPKLQQSLSYYIFKNLEDIESVISDRDIDVIRDYTKSHAEKDYEMSYTLSLGVFVTFKTMLINLGTIKDYANLNEEKRASVLNSITEQIEDGPITDYFLKNT